MQQLTWLSKNDQRIADLTVLIVSWNVKDILMNNLKTLLASHGNFFVKVIVVDNASNDGTAAALQKEFPEVLLIANLENLGFSKANNQGLEVANSRHVLLLNPDMVVASDALEKTIKYLDAHSEVGVLGARLEKSDGTVFPSVRRLPDFISQFCILLKLHRLFPTLISRYLWTDFDYSREQDVPQVRGSYFAISENALTQIPRLDERFFIWFEEVDYCREILKRGLKVRFVPHVSARDFVSKSFAQRDTFWKFKNFSMSMYLYFKKWEPGWQASMIGLTRFLFLPLVWLIAKFKKICQS